MLLLVSLGLAPPSTITQGALVAIKSADKVYLENYTSLGITTQKLQEFLGKNVQSAPRKTVESEKIIEEARNEIVALCIIGDVFTATTHSTIYLDCLKEGIEIQIHQNAGIINAVGITGLELYKFGQTVSVPYPLEGYAPQSYLDKIRTNRKAGLHTLCLLDIRADEERFMTIPEAINLLSKELPERIIGVAQLGSLNHIKAGSPQTLLEHKWPAQPHSIVIPGNLNAVEEEFMEYWSK